ncbi:unnamed protein product [Oikopleura dioica]|uniref:PH domain-containing protein n=1 Tax=Oikopleura dioica TaxID=34765 RepID=E4XSD0_OIKDI|nr:unnamed protein product [Oikopleura dioica]
MSIKNRFLTQRAPCLSKVSFIKPKLAIIFDTERLFEADLNSSFSFEEVDASKRLWLLSNGPHGHLRIRLLLEEDNCRDDWVTSIRWAIEMAANLCPNNQPCPASNEVVVPHDRILLRQDGTKELLP